MRILASGVTHLLIIAIKNRRTAMKLTMNKKLIENKEEIIVSL